MNWEQICADPLLKDLPYKIELNKWGQIIMSPASIRHVLFQDCITDLLKSLMKTGKTLQEFPVETEENVKAPDVVWLSQGLFKQIKENISSPVAPEICIEVMSPGNTKLYFDAGAEEVWICDENGNMKFYNQTGELSYSVLVPEFPKKVEYE